MIKKLKMTIKEAIIKSLQELKTLSTYMDVYNHIAKNDYYNFGEAKTPSQTISASLGHFIRKGDSRVKRIKNKKGSFSYYLTALESDINLEVALLQESEKKNASIPKQLSYSERDLHILLGSYLNNQKVFSKTIFHQKSTGNDNHQKWIHPDMVGVNFLNLQNKVSQTFLKVINRADTFKIISYEIKKEINTDYDLKKCFFQAVSNSSWANYGYLVALEISDSLADEMERLNQSFGIGIIELKSNPFESKVLFPSRYKELDFKTIDKLCKINKDFENFIEQVEKLLTASERYVQATKQELKNFCDDFFTSDAKIEEYCNGVNIPFEKD